MDSFGRASFPKTWGSGKSLDGKGGFSSSGWALYPVFVFLFGSVVLISPKPLGFEGPSIAMEFRIDLCPFRTTGSKRFSAVFGRDEELWPLYAGGKPAG